jgi:hypothetical protein
MRLAHVLQMLDHVTLETRAEGEDHPKNTQA